jgi:polyisoprenoid-binding protein YceI
MRRAKGSIHVFTFKDGLLARAAHDLRLALGRFEVTLEDDRVDGTFDLRTLAVDGPVERGAVHPERFGAGERTDIERNVRADVLHTDRYPEARFSGRALPRGDGFQVTGDLELAGRRAPIAFDVRRQDGVYRAALDLQPSRWGIAPYRALLGAIRLKDAVRIELALSDA